MILNCLLDCGTVLSSCSHLFGTKFVKTIEEMGAQLRIGTDISRLRGKFDARMKLIFQLLRVKAKKELSNYLAQRGSSQK